VKGPITIKTKGSYHLEFRPGSHAGRELCRTQNGAVRPEGNAPNYVGENEKVYIGPWHLKGGVTSRKKSFALGKREKEEGGGAGERMWKGEGETINDRTSWENEKARIPCMKISEKVEKKSQPSGQSFERECLNERGVHQKISSQQQKKRV